jgi:hypothetical protein
LELDEEAVAPAAEEVKEGVEVGDGPPVGDDPAAATVEEALAPGMKVAIIPEGTAIPAVAQDDIVTRKSPSILVRALVTSPLQ